MIKNSKHRSCPLIIFSLILLDVYVHIALFGIFVDNASVEGWSASRASLVVIQGKLAPEKRAAFVAQGKALKARLAVLEAQVEVAEDALQREGQKLPNLSHPEVS